MGQGKRPKRHVSFCSGTHILWGRHADDSGVALSKDIEARRRGRKHNDTELGSSREGGNFLGPETFSGTENGTEFSQGGPQKTAKPIEMI